MPRTKLQRLEKKSERATKRADKSVSRYKKDAEKRTPDVSISGILPRIVTSRLEAKAKNRSARASALKKKVEEYKGKNDGTKKENMAKKGSVPSSMQSGPKRTTRAQKFGRVAGMIREKHPLATDTMKEKLKKNVFKTK